MPTNAKNGPRVADRLIEGVRMGLSTSHFLESGYYVDIDSAKDMIPDNVWLKSWEVAKKVLGAVNHPADHRTRRRAEGLHPCHWFQPNRAGD
jgi:hypothetical protein